MAVAGVCNDRHAGSSGAFTDAVVRISVCIQTRAGGADAGAVDGITRRNPGVVHADPSGVADIRERAVDSGAAPHTFREATLHHRVRAAISGIDPVIRSISHDGVGDETASDAHLAAGIDEAALHEIAIAPTGGNAPVPHAAHDYVTDVQDRSGRLGAADANIPACQSENTASLSGAAHDAPIANADAFISADAEASAARSRHPDNREAIEIECHVAGIDQYALRQSLRGHIRGQVVAAWSADDVHRTGVPGAGGLGHWRAWLDLIEGFHDRRRRTGWRGEAALGVELERGGEQQGGGEDVG